MPSAFLILIPQKSELLEQYKKDHSDFCPSFLAVQIYGILHCGDLLALMCLASLCNMPYICTVVSLIFCSNMQQRHTYTLNHALGYISTNRLTNDTNYYDILCSKLLLEYPAYHLIHEDRDGHGPTVQLTSNLQQKNWHLLHDLLE